MVWEGERLCWAPQALHKTSKAFQLALEIAWIWTETESRRNPPQRLILYNNWKKASYPQVEVYPSEIMNSCVSQVLPELHIQAGAEVAFLLLQYLVLKIFYKWCTSLISYKHSYSLHFPHLDIFSIGTRLTWI